MVTAKKSEQRQSRKVVTDKSLERSLPTSVQKSYFMLSDAERAILNTALGKYRPGQSQPILVGGKNLLKPALRLMRNYRLAIEEIRDGQAVTSYTRWVDAVQVMGGETRLPLVRAFIAPKSNRDRLVQALRCPASLIGSAVLPPNSN